MDLDHYWFSDRVRDLPLFLSHRSAYLSLCDELLLAWLHHCDRALGNLLYSAGITYFLK